MSLAPFPTLAPLPEPPLPDPARATAFQSLVEPDMQSVDNIANNFSWDLTALGPALDSGVAALLDSQNLLGEAFTVHASLAADIDSVDFTPQIKAALAAAAEVAAASGDVDTTIASLGS